METLTHLFITATILGVAVFTAHKMSWLNPTGALAAWLVGFCIVWAGGWLFLVPMLVFFLAGSLSGLLHNKTSQKTGRNAVQVLTNGGVAVLSLILWKITGEATFMTCYFASVSISLTDTVSGDIGMAGGRVPYDIISLKPVEPGLSGGVTFTGTAGGLGVSVLYSLLCYFIFDIRMTEMYIIGVCGMAGMITDSLLGSLYQAKYLDSGHITDSPENQAVLVRGRRWMTNEMVNLVSNLLLTACTMAVTYTLI